jgi:hypothetical protein
MWYRLTKLPTCARFSDVIILVENKKKVDPGSGPG